METKRSPKIKGYVRMIALVLVVALLAVLPLMASRNVDDGKKASILSGTASLRTLNHRIIAGGSLDLGETTRVELPYGVKVRELIAHNGDDVREGDPIARVDKVSVMTAVTQVQDALNLTEKQMQKLSYTLNLGAVTVDEEGTLYSDGKAIPEDKMADYAQYLSLAQQHRDYEDIMVKLFLMYREGTINAPAEGMLDGLDASVVEKLSAGDGEYQMVFLAHHVPVIGEDGTVEDTENDETYTGYVGVITAVLEEKWDMLVDPRPQEITDFTQPGADTSRMTATMVTDSCQVLVYGPKAEEAGEEEEPKEPKEGEEKKEPEEKEWSLVTAAPGDVLLFVDNWVIKIGTQEIKKPTDPNSNKTPANMEEALAQVMANGMGGLGGGSYGGSSRESSEMYSLVCTTLCTVVPQDTMTLTVMVDEQDILKVSEGIEATVVFDAMPEETFHAVVSGRSKFGSSNGGSSKFAVWLDLPFREGMLPGMNATATLEMEAEENVLTVPAAALVETGTQTLIYTGFDEKNETLLDPVEVTTGLSDGENVQILTGLTPGTPFWYSYYDKVEISNAVKSNGIY